MNVHSSLRDTDIFGTGSTFPMSFPRSTPIADLTPAATCIRFPNGCSTSTLSPMPSSWIRARAQRYTECHFLASREAPHLFSDVVECWRFTYSIHAASLCIISFRSCTNNASHHSYGGREKKLAEQGTPAGIKAAVDVSEAVANKATGAAK
jgi:hypothetical protein